MCGDVVNFKDSLIKTSAECIVTFRAPQWVHPCMNYEYNLNEVQFEKVEKVLYTHFSEVIHALFFHTLHFRSTQFSVHSFFHTLNFHSHSNFWHSHFYALLFQTLQFRALNFPTLIFPTL